MRQWLRKAFFRCLYKREDMPVDQVWLTPHPGRASKLWSGSSLLVLSFVTAVSKIWLGWFNKPVVYKKQVLIDAIDKRAPKRPLITTCNHYSMVDDPLLAYMLSWRHIWNLEKLRWLPGAKDVCNKAYLYSMFFQLGKVLPVGRGDGVYQHGMNFCVDRLSEGQWVSIYPEGKINMERESMRLKWGIGRLVADSKVCPIVVPYWHVGMENVLPTVEPYRLRRGNDVTVLIGDPLDFEDDLKSLREQGQSVEYIRKYITDVVQEAFKVLKNESERLHNARVKTKDSSS